jgi:hypothetical protein
MTSRARWRRSTAPASPKTANDNNTTTMSGSGADGNQLQQQQQQQQSVKPKTGATIGDWTRSTGNDNTTSTGRATNAPTASSSSSGGVVTGSGVSNNRRATAGGALGSTRKTSDTSSLRVALLERNAHETATANNNNNNNNDERLTRSTPAPHRYLGSPSSSQSTAESFTYNVATTAAIGTRNGGGANETKSHSIFASDSPMEERLHGLKMLSSAGQRYEAAAQRDGESSIIISRAGGVAGPKVDSDESDSDDDPQDRRRLDLYKQVSEAGASYEHWDADVDVDDSDDDERSKNSTISSVIRGVGLGGHRAARKGSTGLGNGSRIDTNGTRRYSNPRVRGTHGRPPVDDDDDDDWADSVDSLVVGRPQLVDARTSALVAPAPTASAAAMLTTTSTPTPVPTNATSSSSSLQCPSTRGRSRSPVNLISPPNSPPPHGSGRLSPSSPKVPTRMTSRRPPHPSPSPPLPSPLPSSAATNASSSSSSSSNFPRNNNNATAVATSTTSGVLRALMQSSLSPPGSNAPHFNFNSPSVGHSASSLDRTLSNDSTDDNSPIPDAPIAPGGSSAWHDHHNNNASSTTVTRTGGAGARDRPFHHAYTTSTSTLVSNAEAFQQQSANATLAMLRHVSATGYEYERHATPSASPVAMPLYQPVSPSVGPLTTMADSDFRVEPLVHQSTGVSSPRSTTEIQSPSSARNKVTYTIVWCCLAH